MAPGRDVSDVGRSNDENFRRRPGRSGIFFTLVFTFGGHDGIAELNAALPKVKAFLESRPAYRGIAVKVVEHDFYLNVDARFCPLAVVDPLERDLRDEFPNVNIHVDDDERRWNVSRASTASRLIASSPQ